MIKKNDFVEVNFAAKIKDSGEIFDLTDEELAKEKNLYNSNQKYGAKVICVSQGFVIKGLDDSFIGKKEGEKYSITISPENAFGLRSQKLIEVVPLKEFHDKKIRPFVGLKLNMGGFMGNVRSVTGGRVTLDFNHPLAGKELLYDVTLGKIIKDDREKLKYLLIYGFGVEGEIKEEEGSYLISLKNNLSGEVKNRFIEKCKEIIPKVKIKFS